MNQTFPPEVPNQSPRSTLADLLVGEGILTPEQLQQAIQARTRGKTLTPLGEACVQLGFFPRVTFTRFLARHQTHIPFGELLTNLRLISEEQLHQALAAQEKEKGKRLGTILVEQGMLTEAALANALSLQLQVPRITPEETLIDRNLLKDINPTFLLRHEALPAFRQGDTLTVIMADPLDCTTVRDLERAFNLKIQPAVAPAQEIRNAIAACFPPESSLAVPEGGAEYSPSRAHHS
jgi:type IV pilus assembly protein PilB